MINRIRWAYLAALLLLSPVSSGASLQLPHILSDHMVLQQNTEVNIWGWAAPGMHVEVATGWDSTKYETFADEDGDWLLKVKTGPAGGPFAITVVADTTLEISDILLGEVWICSGQSNMELPLKRAGTATTEIPRSLFPDIRLFTVEKRIASKPREDVSGRWERCRPESAGTFSAVGYFFGKNIHQQRRVPVGMIHASWGGTPAEAWTSRETLRNFDYFYGDLKQLDNVDDSTMDLAENKRDSLELAIRRQSDFLNPGNVGFREGWMKQEFDDSEWLEIPCPAEWSTLPEIGIFEGVAWLRTRFVIPDAWVGKSLVIELGPIDEMDVTYLNGRKVGSSLHPVDWDKPRVYKIPGHLVTEKECALTLRIVNTRGQGGLMGKPGELKIYPMENAGKNALMLDGTWKFKVTYRFPKLPQTANPKTPTVLFNGMISPLKDMTIRGAIWYQGEANVNRAMQYRKLFPALINDWRNQWNQGDFPFYFVQLAPYRYKNEFTAAELREAQFLTLSKVNHTGMAVILDIGNPVNIHPANKRDVGKRLALWALANDYNQNLVYSGPLYREQEIEGSSIRIFFDHTGGGLEARGGLLTDFEIAGSDRVYRNAIAVIDGSSMVVSHPEIRSPVAVRYGWRNAAEPKLFNKEGLPASSFSTDRWPRVTEEAN